MCRYKTLNETTSSCLGGDNLLGLKVMENDANITVGDIIVGRESGSFLGKVSNKKSFLEAMQFYKINQASRTLISPSNPIDRGAASD